MNIVLTQTPPPPRFDSYRPVNLTGKTMEEHRRKVLLKMEEARLDALVLYADREHGSNFAYLTGFEPRFEEAALVLHRDGQCFLLLGNENLKMAQHSRIQALPLHVPHFSLPCQPMETEFTLPQLLGQAGLGDFMRIGCVGWKYFTARGEEQGQLFDLPAFLLDALRQITPHGALVPAAGIFLHPADGLRTRVNANEIAHYEYGAGLASHCVGQVLDTVAPGKTERELAALLSPDGQPVNVTTICATGDRFTDAVVFPRDKRVTLGDKFSVTLGLRGGLTSRAAYVAKTEQDLPLPQRDYLTRVAIPYYRAAVTWFETVGIGVTGGELYDAIARVLPKEEYHWVLNPGHYTGDDEWVTSPFFPSSPAVLGSGMLLQMDILPGIPGYGGANAEDGVALCDQALREELQRDYPETFRRMQARRRYMQQVLGIRLKEEVLPMSDLCGYLRPYLLDRDRALQKARG